MTIDADKTLELLHNSPCGFSYDTNPSRYIIEQKELVKFVNFIYNKALDDFIHECDKYCGFYIGNNKIITREDILKIAEQLKEWRKKWEIVWVIQKR